MFDKEKIKKILGQKSFLLVDDEEAIRSIYEDMFSSYSGKLFIAADGKEAADLLKSNEIDIVVSDVRMPVYDGLYLLDEFYEKYKGQQEWPIFIFVTGYADLDPVELRKKGVTQIFYKPHRIKEIIQFITSQFKA